MNRLGQVWGRSVSYLIGVFNAEVGVAVAEGGAVFNSHEITAGRGTCETAIGDVVCPAALVGEASDGGWLGDCRGVGVLKERKKIASVLEDLSQLGWRQGKGGLTQYSLRLPGQDEVHSLSATCWLPVMDDPQKHCVPNSVPKYS
jgi:hypothetical protein